MPILIHDSLVPSAVVKAEHRYVPSLLRKMLHVHLLEKRDHPEVTASDEPAFKVIRVCYDFSEGCVPYRLEHVVLSKVVALFKPLGDVPVIVVSHYALAFGDKVEPILAAAIVFMAVAAVSKVKRRGIRLPCFFV